MRKLVSLATAATAVLALAPAAAAATPRLFATVGPSDTISLKTASGVLVRTLRAGTYIIVVRDRATDHNFHLAGYRVNRQTSISRTGTVTWTVRFFAGRTYRYWCDPHSLDMRGTFRVR